jgi:hypothetical protein
MCVAPPQQPPLSKPLKTVHVTKARDLTFSSNTTLHSPLYPAASQMGLLTIIKKVKRKEREMRILMV